MSWKVKFKKELYDELHQYLFEVAPSENGCFLLANHIGNILFVTDIIYPSERDWLNIGEDMCVSSSNYLSFAANKADNENKALIFVHSHPREFHPSTFSRIDVVSNEKMFENLSELVENPLSSLVFSKQGIHGTVYWDSVHHDISDYSIIGRTLDFNLDTSMEQKSIDEEELNRQLLFMKQSAAQNLASLNIAIVGLGGIGSPLAVMLSKMGVQNMTFFDNDEVEVHNLPRIQGASKSSIGRHKAVVVKDFIESFSDAAIDVQLKMISDADELMDFDLIFGCVDNHTARDTMNKASYMYAIPYIDSACAIPLNEKGEVEQSVVAVNTVTPDSACLWCSQMLNAIQIMEESLTEEELKQRVVDGYTLDVGKAPSVICLTSAVASMAINRMLNLLGVYSDEYSDRVIIDFNSTLLNESNFEKSKKCTCTTQSAFK
jgi:hypothetical protein